MFAVNSDLKLSNGKTPVLNVTIFIVKRHRDCLRLRPCHKCWFVVKNVKIQIRQRIFQLMLRAIPMGSHYITCGVENQSEIRLVSGKKLNTSCTDISNLIIISKRIVEHEQYYCRNQTTLTAQMLYTDAIII